MANKKRPNRPTTPYSKTHTPSPVPKQHVRLSAEYWLEVFTDRLMQSMGDESLRPWAVRDAVNDAHALADAALDAYERRWPGVKQIP